MLYTRVTKINLGIGNELNKIKGIATKDTLESNS